MRISRVLGSSIAIALTALVLSGGGSASASTELCKAVEEPCSAENRYPPGTSLEATSSEAVLKSSLANVVCTGSTIRGETDGEAGVPLPTEIGTLSFSGCKSEGSECTVTALETPYLGQIEATAENAGSLTLRNGYGEEPAATIKCASTCTYSAEAIELQLKGGNPGQIVASEESLKKKSGFLCPETATWTATYTIQQPKPIDVLKFPTKLCKAAPEKTETTCPAGEEFSGEIKGTLSGNVSIVSLGMPAGSVTCTESAMKGKFNGNGTGEISSLSFNSNKGGECTSLLKGNPNVAVSMLNLPAVNSAFSYFGVGKGLLIIDGKKFLEMSLLIAGEKKPASTNCPVRSCTPSTPAR